MHCYRAIELVMFENYQIELRNNGKNNFSRSYCTIGYMAQQFWKQDQKYKTKTKTKTKAATCKTHQKLTR